MTAHPKDAPARCGKYPDRLYDCTEDEKKKDTDPTTLEDAKKNQHRWYVDEENKGYKPYFIKVVDIDDENMIFKFLNSFTGEPLFKDRDPNRIRYRDIRYAWAELPSTAHMAKKGDPKDHGILFISKQYMNDPQNLPGGEADRQLITDTGGGDGKWPFSAGKNRLSKLEQLRRSISGLSESARQDFEELFKFVESVTAYE